MRGVKRRVLSIFILLGVLLTLFVSLKINHKVSLAAKDIITSAFEDIKASMGNRADGLKEQIINCLKVENGFKNATVANTAGGDASKGYNCLQAIYSSWAPGAYKELTDWLDDEYKNVSKKYRIAFRSWLTDHTNDYKTVTCSKEFADTLGIGLDAAKKTMLTIPWGIGFTSAGKGTLPKLTTDDLLHEFQKLVSDKKTKKKLKSLWIKMINSNSLYTKINKYIEYGTNAAIYTDSASAETTITKLKGGKLPLHDGKLMSKKNIYRKLENYSASTDAKDYIDVAIPYEVDKKKLNNPNSGKVGQNYAREGDAKTWGYSGDYTMSKTLDTELANNYKSAKKSSKKKSSPFLGKTISKDKIGTFYAKELKGPGYKKKFPGLNVVVDAYESHYVLIAVQSFFFKNITPQSYTSSYGFKRAQNHSGQPEGTLIDAIYTDGTILRCIQYDINGDADTNSVSGKWAHYRHIMGESGNCLEICGTSPNEEIHQGLFNLVTSNGKNKLCYYRIYDANLNNATTYQPRWKDLVVHDPDTKVVDANLNDDDTNDPNDPNAKDPTKDNMEYGGKSERTYVTQQTLDEKYVKLLDRSELTDDELYNINMWQEDVESTDLQVYIIDASRWLIILLGILIIIWMIVIYICYWLDTVNNFVDIEFLPAVTFKRLRRAELEEDVTWTAKGEEHKGGPRTIDHKRLLIVVILGIILGALVVSGKLFLWTASIMNWVFNLFGNMWNAVT